MTKFPKFVFIDDSDLERDLAENIVRSEMEVGPQKTKPIQSIPLFNLTFAIAIPECRFTEFNNWFKSVKYGASWFLMRDPSDGVERRFRIVGAETFVKAGTLWRSKLTVEAYDV